MSNFGECTNKFSKWISENFSTVSPKFEIKDLRDYNQGRGLIATEDIAKNDVIFELSRDVILNINSASITQLRPENKKILNSLNQWQTLIICVAYEWYIGDRSKFINYLNVLPLKQSDYNSLMFWTDEELQYLKPSGVIDRIGKSSAEEMYSLLVADIIPNHLNCQELADFLTLERFHIVASLIMSYSFDVDHPDEIHESENTKEEIDEEGNDDDDSNDDNEVHENEEFDQANDHTHENHENHEDCSHEHNHDHDDYDEDDGEDLENEDPVSSDTYLKSLVPLADTLNSNTSLVNATLKYEKTKLVMIADKAIKKGEQIFNIYGELPNSEILRKYGFVELPSSKFEFGELPQSCIKKYFEKLYLEKFTFIKEVQAEKLIDFFFQTLEESEYLIVNMADETEAGIVLDKYEIYSNGEVLPELLVLILILTAIFKSAETDEKWFKKMVRSIERKPSAEILAFTNRSILKCHQLLTNKGSLTTSTVENLKEILKIRISEYPTHIIDGSYKLPEIYKTFNRKELANVVLFDEVECFKDVINGKFPPKKNKKPLFTIISDEKLLKNLLKRKLEEEGERSFKKQKKI